MKNKTIIVLPGRANDLFFQMELNTIKRYFNKVIVVSYPMNRHLAKEISLAQGIDVRVLPRYEKNPFRMMKWFTEPSVRKEVSNLTGSALEKIKKFAYLSIYGQTYLMAKKEIESLLEKERDIVIYSYWLTRGAYVAARLNHEFPNRYRLAVSRAHGYDLYLHRNVTGYLPFRRYIDEHLDQIFFISKHGKEYYSQMTSQTATSAELKIARLGTRNHQPFDWTKKANAIPVIASCSTIDQNKRIDLIIQVLHKFDFPYRWIHIGDGPEMGNVMGLAHESLPADSVQFLGRLDNEKILEKYAEERVDFLINLSDSEGVPVTMMEALSQGIPVIARNVGGVPEIVTPETGLLIEWSPAEGVDRLAEQIRTFIQRTISDPEQYQYLRASAYQYWEEHYQSEKNFNEFFQYLAEGES